MPKLIRRNNRHRTVLAARYPLTLNLEERSPAANGKQLLEAAYLLPPAIELPLGADVYGNEYVAVLNPDEAKQLISALADLSASGKIPE